MTLQSQSNTAVYRGNSAATEFPFTFPIPRGTLVVSLQDYASGETTRVLDETEYSVTGYDSPNGGTVIYTTVEGPITSAQSLVIQRIVPYTQELDLLPAGGFAPEAVEKQLDKIVMQIQQIAEEQGRTIMVPPGQAAPTLDQLLAAIEAAAGIVDDLEELRALAAAIEAGITDNLGIKLDVMTVSGQLDYEFSSLVPDDAEFFIEGYLAGGRLVPNEHYQIVAGGTNNFLRLTSDPEGAYRLLAFGALNFSVVPNGGGTGPSGPVDSDDVENVSTVDGETVTEALDELKTLIEAIDTGGGEEPVTTFSVWPSGRARTLQQRSKFECHIADFCAPSSSVDNTDKIIEWARQGQVAGVKLLVGAEGTGRADYILTKEIEITRVGQVMEFDQMGGWGHTTTANSKWIPNLRFLVKGGVGGWFNTTGKRIRTRRLYRANSGSPQDPAYSAAINIQAAGVLLIRPSVFLDYDLDDPSPSNMGDYCDIGIFSGSRMGVQIHEARVIGYFRRAGVYFDASHASALPRHLSVAGTPYAEDVNFPGADGCGMTDPYIRGGRVTLAVLGAKPKSGQTDYSTAYYDQQLGAAVTDSRGAGGHSDFLVTGGALYGPDHHSGYRRANPTQVGGVLNQTSLNAEPDDMPAALHIDGLAGNSSSNIWGMRFIGVRFASYEAFRVRLGKASRIDFFASHFEGRNGGKKNTSGTEVDTNDYAHHTYGSIAGTANTDRVMAIGTAQQSNADGIAPHFYGPSGVSYWTESGRLGLGKGGYILSETDEMDIRGAAGTGVRFRSGTSTILIIPPGGVNGTTTASSANVNISGGNTLSKSTSSIKWKTDVEDMDKELRAEIVGKLRAVWYRSTADMDNPDWSWWGLIAEEVREIDPRLVTYDDEGNPNGVMYDRIAVLLLDEVQEMRVNYSTLEARVTKLEGKK